MPDAARNYHSGMDEAVFVPGARAVLGLEYAPNRIRALIGAMPGLEDIPGLDKKFFEYLCG